MGTHRSYPDIRRRNRVRNYFGDGSLGHVRVISAGSVALAPYMDGDATGTMLDGGGLRSAFDGITSVAQRSGCFRNISTANYLNTVGKLYDTLRVLSRLRVFGPSDNNILGPAGGTTVKIQGTTNRGASWFDLTSGIAFPSGSAQILDITTGISTTPINGFRLAILGNGSNTVSVAEVEPYFAVAKAEHSTDGGSTWSDLGWTISGPIVSVPSVLDGDMVVLHCLSWRCDAGFVVTTVNRCRGLLVYVKGDCVHNGAASMTARGPRANPADATATGNTPTAPSDGHAVPASGITIRRLSQSPTAYVGADNTTTLMHGCGTDAVTAEANQPPVANGVVVRIPRIGGVGGVALATPAGSSANGGTAAFAPGGGGSGQTDPDGTGGTGGAGAAATCFGGGSGGAGGDDGRNGGDAVAYCGAGGAATSLGSSRWAGAGAGNPAGAGGLDGYNTPAGIGVGGLLLIIIGGALSGVGSFVSCGSYGGNALAPGQDGAGGASGGGVAGVLVAGSVSGWSGTLSADGGEAGLQTYYATYAGAGGAGAVIGPLPIDPA